MWWVRGPRLAVCCVDEAKSFFLYCTVKCIMADKKFMAYNVVSKKKEAILNPTLVKYYTKSKNGKAKGGARYRVKGVGKTGQKLSLIISSADAQRYF